MTSPDTSYSNEELFDIIAQNIKTGVKRFLDKGKTEANADAIVKMAVMRRGCDEEFYYMVPTNSTEADSTDYDHYKKHA
jgi:hypothetical protein